METNREKCIKMWEWLAETGQDKYEYFQKFDLDFVDSECYACEEAGDGECNRCPVTWGLNTRCCDPGSPYIKWCIARTTKANKLAAAKVLKVIKETWKE